MSDVISNEGRELSELVNFVITSFTIGVFGIVGNIINIIVFYKQGFSSVVNIAFFSLAISDMCCLLFLIWVCICINPLFIESGIPWVTRDIAFLSGSWLHVCFCRITSYITIYITTERYLSIAFPLKVKQIITPRRTILITCFIYVVNISALTPEYISSYLDWKFIPNLNKSLIALTYNSNRGSVEGVENVLHSVLGAASFLGVVIATVALVTKLRATSKWRRESTFYSGNSVKMSVKERKVVKMVVLIACAMIVCYTPGVVICLATYIVGPEFNMLGRYLNSCVAMWSIAYSFQTINSSINVLFYYRMSSKYKRTFRELFFKNWRRL